MMRKYIAISILISCILLGGCSAISSVNQDITDNSKAITIDDNHVYVNPNDPEDGYQVVTVNNRDYILFGTQGKTITGDMIGECIAYDSEDNARRYYRVVGTDDYIAEYYVVGVMEQFVFLRAIDTMDKDIDTPNFIDDLDYDIWKW